MTHFPIKDLKRADYNPRIMPDAEMQSLMKSIESKGFIEPIVVNVVKDRYGVIVGGHQRLTAVEKLIAKGIHPKGIKLKEETQGAWMIPCFTVELTIEEEKEANIALNRIHGKFDEDKLFDIIVGMQESPTISSSGLSEKEIMAVIHSHDDVVEKTDINASVCDRCSELKLMVQGHARKSRHPIKVSDKDFQIVNDAIIGMPRKDALEDATDVIEGVTFRQGQEFFIAERVEYPESGGIFVHYKGMPFPAKGFPTPEASFRNDIVKRITLTIAKGFTGPELILPAAMFAILPWKLKKKAINRVLENYCRIGQWLFIGSFQKYERLTPTAKAVRKIVDSMCVSLGLSDDVIQMLGKVVSHIIELDDAYRYRLQDLMSETSKTELSELPFNAVSRIAEIAYKREKMAAVRSTLKAVSALMHVIVVYPKTRKAFKRAISNLSIDEFKGMQLDNADRYHVLLRDDYDFTGRPFDERRNIYIDFHTFSKCCRSGVLEKKYNHGVETICKKCGKKCEWTQEFPPKMTVTATEKQ